MKHAIMAMMVAMALAVAPTFAWTYIDTSVTAPLGETHFTQTQKTQGAWYGDGNGGSWSGSYYTPGKTTAYTTESFDNVGSVKYTSTFSTNSNYASVRNSDLETTGVTNYDYTFKARSLNTGKPRDVTQYVVTIDAYTQSGDEESHFTPGLAVEGTAPGYAGDDAHDWSIATIVTNGVNTNENFVADTFAWVNPQNW